MATALEPLVVDESEMLYEVVDGVIVEKPPMGSFEEFITNLLASKLMAAADATGAGRAFAECMFDFGDEVGRKMRPDLSFVSGSRWPMNKPAPRGNGWRVVPNLAVEVISDSNTSREIAQKVRHYFEVGVEQVWIVEPVEEWIQIYSSPKSITVLSRDDELTCDLIPGFRLPLAQLFLRDDE